MAVSTALDAALSAASGAFFTASIALLTVSVAFSSALDAALSAASGAFFTASTALSAVSVAFSSALDALSTSSTLSVSCAGYSEALRAAL